MVAMKNSLMLLSFCVLGISCGRRDLESDSPKVAANSKKIENQALNLDASTDKKVEIGLVGSSNEALKEKETEVNKSNLSTTTSSDEYFCKSGFYFDQKIMLCLSETKAVGPFSLKMRELCVKSSNSKELCDGNEWPRELAIRLRGTDDCIYGTSWDKSRKICTESENAFGPFLKDQFDDCKNLGAGLACETNRWHKSLVRIGTQPKPVVSEVTRKLLDYYSVYSNYLNVSEKVKVFYPPHVKNGCVAFMSEALRQSGYPIPKNQTRNGYNVSLVTPGFTAYLKEKNWKRIGKSADLIPGDVVFTLPEDSWPGVSAHTYMFQRWANKADGIGVVIDNQGFSHNRNIWGYGSHNFTPFWYAMRAP